MLLLIHPLQLHATGRALSSQLRCEQARLGALARLDLVALVVAEASILSWAHCVASAGRRASVTLANGAAVLIVRVALAPEPGGHLDASAADLHNWSSNI